MSRIKHSAPAVLGVLAASVLLGLAYNSASPLGVRSKQVIATGAIGNATTQATARPPATRLAPATSSVAPPAAAPTPYQNQTVAMSLEPLPAAAPPPTAAVPPAAPSPQVNPRPVVQNITWAEVKPLLAGGKSGDD